jgi:uracil-DNA glycosylase family 4
MTSTYQKLSPYQRLIGDWKGCVACGLCEGRRQVVFARGTLPAQYLFVGEAPGMSEDVDAQARPFVGPAGKLLDQAIGEALIKVNRTYLIDRLSFFNLVGCMPKDEEGRKRGEPLQPEIDACYPRLTRFMGLCKPETIVTVGEVSRAVAAENVWAKTYRVEHIIHPAAILRMDVTQKGLAYQKCVDDLADIFVPF